MVIHGIILAYYLAKGALVKSLFSQLFVSNSLL